MEKITVNGIELVPHQRYGTYLARDCRKTGLPMLDKNSRYQPGAKEYYSRTQRSRMHKPIQGGEAPEAWYRVENGYVPLYGAGE